MKNFPPRRKRTSHVGRNTALGSSFDIVTTGASLGRKHAKEALGKSSHQTSHPRPRTIRECVPIPTTRPVTEKKPNLPELPAIVTTEDFFFNWPQYSRKSCTSDERIFCLAARQFGLSHAVQMAECFEWKYKRPLRAFFGAYHASMKSSSEKSPEYIKFEDAMRALLRASKPEVDREVQEAAERQKATKTRKPKRIKPSASA